MGGRSIASLALVAVLAATACGAKASPPAISALRELPAATALSPQIRRALGGMAHNAGLTAADAVDGTRLVRDVSGVMMYAFGGSDGRVCFLVVNGVGTCGHIDAAADVLWAVDPGEPGRSQAVVGMVSDRVVAVSVEIGTRRVRVRPVHNSFLAPLRLRAGRRLPQLAVTAVL